MGKNKSQSATESSDKVYRKSLNFSQKIGNLIMYQNNMKDYKISKYNIEGVTDCEKEINLPVSFKTAKEHFLYFGNDFEKC